MKLDQYSADLLFFDEVVEQGISNFMGYNLSTYNVVERLAVHYRHQDKTFNIYYNDGERHQIYCHSAHDGQVYFYPTQIEKYHWSNGRQNEDFKRRSFQTKEQMLDTIGKENGYQAWQHFTDILNWTEEAAR